MIILSRSNELKKKTSKKKLAFYLVLIIVLILIISFAFKNTRDDIHFEEEIIFITNSNGDEIEMNVLVAEDSEQNEKGLMGRETLCDYCGMLFVFEEDVEGGFWMKDTYIPLSIAFISESGMIMEIRDMEPETTEVHKPEEPYRFALEVNQGFFEDNDIVVGDNVVIPEIYK